MFVTTERENIASMNDMYAAESNPQVAEFIAEALHISIEKARVLHLNMLIYNVGIGTILTTATPGIQWKKSHRNWKQPMKHFAAGVNRQIN